MYDGFPSSSHRCAVPKHRTRKVILVIRKPYTHVKPLTMRVNRRRRCHLTDYESGGRPDTMILPRTAASHETAADRLALSFSSTRKLRQLRRESFVGAVAIDSASFPGFDPKSFTSFARIQEEVEQFATILSDSVSTLNPARRLKKCP